MQLGSIRGGVVSMVTSLRPERPSSIPFRDKRFVSPNRPDSLWGPPGILYLRRPIHLGKAARV